VGRPPQLTSIVSSPGRFAVTANTALPPKNLENGETVIPTLKLPSLAVILGTLGNYWVVFQTHAVTDLKTAAVAAGTFLIGWANHQAEATKRNETDAAARLGQSPAPAVPSVAEVTRQVVAAMTQTQHGAGGPSIPVPPGPSTI
jgi:hypothetical protein